MKFPENLIKEKEKRYNEKLKMPGFRLCPFSGNGFHEYRLLRMFNLEKKRFIHFYCIFCGIEELKLCDYDDEWIKEYLIKNRKGEENKKWD